MGVVSVFPHDLKNLLSGWRLVRLKNPKAVGNYLPRAMSWNVWKERNKRIFENIVTSLDDLCVLTFRFIHNWCSIRKVMQYKGEDTKI